jgi:hypothetical protein
MIRDYLGSRHFIDEWTEELRKPDVNISKSWLSMLELAIADASLNAERAALFERLLTINVGVAASAFKTWRSKRQGPPEPWEEAFASKYGAAALAT